MDPDADLAAVASLIADRHRAQMLLVLLGGTPQSGSALAEAAGISRSLASAHLKKLVAGGLVRAQPSGRQQLYSIASEPVADALEILILLAPATRVGSLGEATRAKSLRWARMCYDHLAGASRIRTSSASATGSEAIEYSCCRPLGWARTRPPATSFFRCALASERETPAASARAEPDCGVPPSRVRSICARCRSAIRAATEARSASGSMTPL